MLPVGFFEEADVGENGRNMLSRRRGTMLAALLGCMCLPSICMAGWLVNTEGPDVFGDTTVTAINPAANGTGLVFKCNQSDLLQIAYVEKSSDLDSGASIPATLIIQIGKDAPVSLAASVRKWNDTYAGVVAEGRNADAISLVKALGSARDKLAVGIRIGDSKHTASYDAARSADASRAMLKACRLDSMPK